MDFIIDTAGDEELIDKDEFIGDFNISDFENVDPDVLVDLLDHVKLAHQELLEKEKRDQEVEARLPGSKAALMVDQFFLDMGWGAKIGENQSTDLQTKQQRKRNVFKFDNLNLETGKLQMKAASVDIEQLLKQKSVLKPGIEKEFSLPEYSMSIHKQRKLNKRERAKTKGPQWFNLGAPEVTEELKADLQVLKMRSVLDPKHFYKKNDMEILPKYFQVGKVMDSPLDHHNERLTRKQRKTTIVDELLADAEASRYTKRKYTEILQDKKKGDYKSYMKEKRTKSKEQFKKKKKETANKKRIK